MQKFIIQITNEDFSLLDEENLECFILGSALKEEFIRSFAKKAKDLGKICLTEDENTCRIAEVDGTILDLSKSDNIAADYKHKTEGLKKKIIGIICRNRRHEAMLVSECEPDFIIFRAWKDGLENVKELTTWYNEMFLIQSALLPVDEEIDFASFKTDFVVLNDIKYKISIAKK